MNTREMVVSQLSRIRASPFGSALENETVGEFLDRTISFCKDGRLLWRAKFVRICGQRVDCWIITNYPGFKQLTCPHCGAISCFQIVEK